MNHLRQFLNMSRLSECLVLNALQDRNAISDLVLNADQVFEHQQAVTVYYGRPLEKFLHWMENGYGGEWPLNPKLIGAGIWPGHDRPIREVLAEQHQQTEQLYAA